MDVKSKANKLICAHVCMLYIHIYIAIVLGKDLGCFQIFKRMLNSYYTELFKILQNKGKLFPEQVNEM